MSAGLQPNHSYPNEAKLMAAHCLEEVAYVPERPSNPYGHGSLGARWDEEAAAAQFSSTARLGGNRFTLTNLETSAISRAVGGSHGCPLSPAARAVL